MRGVSPTPSRLGRSEAIGQTPDVDRPELLRTLYLFSRYSVEITAVIDRAVGTAQSGNSDLQVLAHLFESGPTSRRDLGELTGLSRSGVAHLVGRLEDAGLVASRQNARDRREVLSVLTPSGRRRLKNLDRALRDHFAASAPLVKEIVGLLGADPERSDDGDGLTPMQIIGHMGSAGSKITRRLDGVIAASGARPRLVLAVLADWGEARPQQLAELLGVTSGGLTYIIDHLEVDGLVSRSHGKVVTDRRAVVITLTDKGRTTVDAIAAALEANASDVAAALLTSVPPGS